MIQLVRLIMVIQFQDFNYMVEGVHSHLIGQTDGNNNKYFTNECNGPAIYTRFQSFKSFFKKIYW